MPIIPSSRHAFTNKNYSLVKAGSALRIRYFLSYSRIISCACNMYLILLSLLMLRLYSAFHVPGPVLRVVCELKITR